MTEGTYSLGSGTYSQYYLPPATDVGLVSETYAQNGPRRVMIRVYEALRERGPMTAAELRRVAYTNGRSRTDGAIVVLLTRMRARLNKHGLTVLRDLGRNPSYRLGHHKGESR
jgi:hypothetical protein